MAAANADGHISDGSGRLEVYPGQIVVRLGRLMRRSAGISEVVHDCEQVEVIRTFLAPPF